MPIVGPYIYDVSISGFTRSSIYIYDISSLRANMVKRLVISLVPILKVIRLMLPTWPLLSLPTPLYHLKLVTTVLTLAALYCIAPCSQAAQFNLHFCTYSKIFRIFSQFCIFRFRILFVKLLSYTRLLSSAAWRHVIC